MPHMHPEFISARWDYVRKMASRDVVDARKLDSVREDFEDAEWSKVKYHEEDAGETREKKGVNQACGWQQRRVSGLHDHLRTFQRIGAI